MAISWILLKRISDMKRDAWKGKGFLKGLFFVLLLGLTIASQSALAMTNEQCLECHSDEGITREADDSSVYVNPDVFAKSVHGSEDCMSCHTDAKGEDEHPPHLKKVRCSRCHEDVAKTFSKSIHGKAHGNEKQPAPSCKSCHGTHDILPPDDPASKVYILNIPATCSTCHWKEKAGGEKGSLPQNAMNIHGGPVQRGVTVAAVCTTCHGSHDVVEYVNPASPVSYKKLKATCTRCHAGLPAIHKNVIKPTLWVKDPAKIPLCIQCHLPHGKRKLKYPQVFTDDYCLKCHSNPNLTRLDEKGGIDSLYVDTDEYDEFAGTMHKKKGLTCVMCHPKLNKEENPVCKNAGPVDCSTCHADVFKDYLHSIHGTKRYGELDPNAPSCVDCHGKHAILAKDNPDSLINPINIPELCASCHAKGHKAAIRLGEDVDVVSTYLKSVHGDGLKNGGLVVSASCVDCHGGHKTLPSSNPKSTVNKSNIRQTCEKCHYGVGLQLAQSVHNPPFGADKSLFPACTDCHTSHEILRGTDPNYRRHEIQACAKCHPEEAETYLESYHGKAAFLVGGERVAHCSDCHGSHDILAVTDPLSTLSGQNAVKTCRKCHPKANLSFTTYRTHASHWDKEKNPDMYYSFIAMTSLLLGTFAIFGLHTILWIPRSLKERLKMKREQQG